MMRQLGGSFGIAVITTFMVHKTMEHRADLVTSLDVNNPAVQARVDAYQHAFMAKGHASNIALGEAYKAMDFSVTKQAMVLSYMDVFLYIGLIFLICIPFVLIVKGKKVTKADLGEAMH